MKQSNWRAKATYVLIGAAAAAAFMLFAGAGPTDSAEIGRYRMCCTPRGSFTEIYVIDTTNGMVKWLGNSDDAKPFHEIK